MQGPGPRGSAAVRFRRLTRGFCAEPLAGIMASPTCGAHRYELNKAGFMATGFGSDNPPLPCDHYPGPHSSDQARRVRFPNPTTRWVSARTTSRDVGHPWQAGM